MTFYNLSLLRTPLQDFDLYVALINIPQEATSSTFTPNVFQWLSSSSASGWKESLDGKPYIHNPSDPGKTPVRWIAPEDPRDSSIVARPVQVAPYRPLVQMGPHRIGFVGEPMTLSAEETLGPLNEVTNQARYLKNQSGSHQVAWFFDKWNDSADTQLGAEASFVGTNAWTLRRIFHQAGLYRVACRVYRNGSKDDSHVAYRMIRIFNSREELARLYPIVSLDDLSGSIQGGGYRLSAKLGKVTNSSFKTGWTTAVVVYAEPRWGTWEANGQVSWTTAAPGYFDNLSQGGILFCGYLDWATYKYDPEADQLSFTARTPELLLEQLSAEWTPFMRETKEGETGHLTPRLTIPLAIRHMLQDHSNFASWHDIDPWHLDRQVSSWAVEKGSIWNSIRSGCENEFYQAYCTAQGKLVLRPDYQFVEASELDAFATLYGARQILWGTWASVVDRGVYIGGTDIVPLDGTTQLRQLRPVSWVQLIGTPAKAGTLVVATYPASPTVTDVNVAIEAFKKQIPNLKTDAKTRGWSHAESASDRALVLQYLYDAADHENPMNYGNKRRLVSNDKGEPNIPWTPVSVGDTYAPTGGPYTTSGESSGVTQNSNNILEFARAMGWIESDPPMGQSFGTWKVVQGHFVDNTPTTRDRLKKITKRIYQVENDGIPKLSVRLAQCGAFELNDQFRTGESASMAYASPLTGKRFVTAVSHQIDVREHTWMTTYELVHYTQVDRQSYYSVLGAGETAEASDANTAYARTLNPLSKIVRPDWWPAHDWPPTVNGPFPEGNPDGVTPTDIIPHREAGLGWLPPTTQGFPSKPPAWWPTHWIFPERRTGVPATISWWPSVLPSPGVYGYAPVIVPGHPNPTWSDNTPSTQPDWWLLHWDWPPPGIGNEHASRLPGTLPNTKALSLVATIKSTGMSDATATGQLISPIPDGTTLTGLAASSYPEPPVRLTGARGMTVRTFQDGTLSSTLRLLLKATPSSTGASGKWPEIQITATSVSGTSESSNPILVTWNGIYEWAPSWSGEEVVTYAVQWLNAGTVSASGCELAVRAVGYADIDLHTIADWRSDAPQFSQVSQGTAVSASYTPAFGKPQVITDGVFPPEQTPYQDSNNSKSRSVQLPTDGTGHLQINLGAEFSLDRAKVQADHNDVYKLSYLSGTAYTDWWNVPEVTGVNGLITRDSGTISGINAQYLRASVVSGDAQYSISEVELYSSTAINPPDFNATLGATASAVGFTPSYGSAALILDGVWGTWQLGDDGTYYCDLDQAADPNNPSKYLSIDLKIIYLVHHLRLQASGDDIVNRYYRIDGSIDQSTWTALWQVKGNNMQLPVESIFAAVATRYLRIVAVSGDGNHSVAEARAYGMVLGFPLLVCQGSERDEGVTAAQDDAFESGGTLPYLSGCTLYFFSGSIQKGYTPYQSSNIATSHWSTFVTNTVTTGLYATTVTTAFDRDGSIDKMLSVPYTTRKWSVQPWSTSWTGYLYLSTSTRGTYYFDVFTNADEFQFVVDGDTVIQMTDCPESGAKPAHEDPKGAPRYLGVGWHKIEVKYAANGAYGAQILHLRWRTPADSALKDFRGDDCWKPASV